MRAGYILPRVVLLLTVAGALLGGLASGLVRLGWQTDGVGVEWINVHGALMICGFLGTLICMERAVALAGRYRWSMIVPIINALGALGLLLVPESALAKLFLTGGSAGLLILFYVMLRLHPSRDMAIMAAGTFCWLTGNVLWLSGWQINQVVHLWTAFLVLTIVGERLELSRVRRLTRTAEILLVLAAGVYLAGVLLTVTNLDAGIRLLGFGAVCLAAWLLHYDIARATVRREGLTRYIAVCLLAGYFWLAFGGVAAMYKGAVYVGPDYAMILHAFLLGFVFSMIFGHAPIILPALTGLQLHYTPLFYGPLLVLHITLAYRTAGALVGNYTQQQQGGLFNVISILLFLGVMLTTLARSNLRR